MYRMLIDDFTNLGLTLIWYTFFSLIMELTYYIVSLVISTTKLNHLRLFREIELIKQSFKIVKSIIHLNTTD